MKQIIILIIVILIRIFPLISQQFSVNWEVKEMPEIVREIDRAGTWYNGNLYIMGGYDSTDNEVKNNYQIDLKNNTWTKKADMPFNSHLHCLFTLNNKIYLIGPEMIKNYIFDPGLNKWESFSACPNSRIPGAVVLFNGKIYIFSGLKNTIFNISDKVDVYNPATDTWSQRKAMPNPKFSPAIVKGDKIYFPGGLISDAQNKTIQSLNTLDIYCPKTDSWEKGEDHPGKGSGTPLILNGNILLIGEKSFIYNIKKDAWSPSDISIPRPTAGAFITIYKNKIIVMGGTMGEKHDWKPYNDYLIGTLIKK